MGRTCGMQEIDQKFIQSFGQKRSFQIPRHKFNIKIEFREMKCEVMNGTVLAQWQSSVNTSLCSAKGRTKAS